MSRYYRRRYSPLGKIPLKIVGMGMSAIAFIAGMQLLVSQSEEWSINVEKRSNRTETLKFEQLNCRLHQNICPKH